MELFLGERSSNGMACSTIGEVRVEKGKKNLGEIAVNVIRDLSD